MIGESKEPGSPLGAYLFSIGVDLLGREDKRKKKGNICFGDLFSESDSSSDDKIKIKRMLLTPKLTTQSGEEITVKKDDILPSWVKSNNGNLNEMVWEYFLRDDSQSNQEFDEFLLRLFLRKHGLLTDKEKKGFTHIKIYDNVIDLSLVTLSSNESDPYTESSDFLMDNSHSYQLPSYKMMNEKRKEYFGVRDFRVRLRAYLFLNLKNYENSHNAKNTANNDPPEKREKMIIGRPATGIFVLEPVCVDDEEKFQELLKNDIYGTVYVNMDCTAVSSLPKDLVKELTQEKFTRKGRAENSESVSYIRFYEFSLAIMWSRFVGKVREKLELEQRYLNFQLFSRALEELRSYQSYEAKILNLGDEPALKKALESSNDLKSDEDLLKLIFPYFKTTVNSEFLAWKNNFINHSAIDITADTLCAYENNTILGIFAKPLFYPETLFRKSLLNFGESGHRWAISWYIMMFSMLSYVSQTFTLFDERLSRHIEEGKETKEIVEITHSAYNDFVEYYDQGIISGNYYKSAYEQAKELFGLTKMYSTLIERLQLFSSYELSEENVKTSSQISLLSRVLVAFTISVVAIEVIRWSGLEFSVLNLLFIIVVLAVLFITAILLNMERKFIGNVIERKNVKNLRRDMVIKDGRKKG